jgi:uncharacterized membrane protein
MKSIIHLFKKYFLKYFGQGLLLVVPITVTIYVLYLIFIKLDTLLDFSTPGLGLLIIVSGVTALGVIGSVLVATPISKWFDGIIDKAPLVKIIYSSVKDLLSAFVGNKKKFTQAVLVRINKESEVYQIGFLTQDDLSDLGIEKDFVSIYVPFSYSIMGNVFVVPKENIKKLAASPTEVMKFVISGGITTITEQRKEKQ